jgi:hypothetical protein
MIRTLPPQLSSIALQSRVKETGGTFPVERDDVNGLAVPAMAAGPPLGNRQRRLRKRAQIRQRNQVLRRSPAQLARVNGKWCVGGDNPPHYGGM